MAESQPHLFVSYASADREQVERIIAVFDAAGFRVWQDRSGIPGGAPYGPAIIGAIRACGALLLCGSEASYGSRNVRQEIALAWKHERAILPLLLEFAAIPEAGPFSRRRWPRLDSTSLGRSIRADTRRARRSYH